MLSKQAMRPSTVSVSNTTTGAATPGSSGFRGTLGCRLPVDDSQATCLNDDDFHRDLPHNKENTNCGNSPESGYDDEDDFVPDSFPLENIQLAPTQFSATQTQVSGPPEWENISPDIILKRCKALSPESTRNAGVRDYYKSYPSWDKMTADQKNKALAWYRSLPDTFKGLCTALFFCKMILYIVANHFYIYIYF